MTGSSLWNHFREIASIPHPSGMEQRLAEHLCAVAKQHGLDAEIDAVSNVKIERKASPGMEKKPRIILQGHLDMVPMAAPGVEHDFAKDPIQLVEKNGWLSTGGRTTLGADDGIGVAAALAILFDPDFHCGPLRLIFTVGEETGLVGANKLNPAWLEADYLLNLDSEDQGVFVCGCAGGCRMDFRFTPEYADPPAGLIPVRVMIGGMTGGHSGSCIHERRGNALKYLAEFLSKHPEYHPCCFEGGTVDNAIPARAYSEGYIREIDLMKLQSDLADFRRVIAERCDLPNDAEFICETIVSGPEKIWSDIFAARFLHGIADVVTGVDRWSEKYNVPETSQNLASCHAQKDGSLLVVVSLRSLVNSERERLQKQTGAYFSSMGADSSVRSAYSAWTPLADQSLGDTAVKVWNSLYPDHPARLEVIHAGLECGVFSGMNPKLPMISYGPDNLDIHTPQERVSIASAEHMLEFTKALIRAIS